MSLLGTPILIQHPSSVLIPCAPLTVLAGSRLLACEQQVEPLKKHVLDKSLV